MRRVSLRGLIIGVVVIVSLIGWLITTTINTITGCSEIQRRFEDSGVAREYAIAFISQLKAENRYDPNSITSQWEVAAQGNGCTLTFTVHARQILRGTTITADTFFVNKETGEIFPQSDGARLFLNEAFDGEVHLPSHNIPTAVAAQPVAPTTIRPSPRPTENPLVAQGCIKWSKVRQEHVGLNICVFGIVESIRSSGQPYTIQFSNDWNDFKIQDWNYNYYYPEVKPGICIIATGLAVDNVSFLVLLPSTDEGAISTYSNLNDCR